MKFSAILTAIVTVAVGVEASCMSDCKKSCGYSPPYCNFECIDRCRAYHCPGYASSRSLNVLPCTDNSSVPSQNWCA